MQGRGVFTQPVKDGAIEILLINNLCIIQTKFNIFVLAYFY